MTKPKPRLTVVEMVYHQLPDVQPVLVESRFARDLKSEESLFSQTITVTEEWQSLQTFGHAVGTLIIANEEGKSLQRIPTTQEKEAVTERIVEVSLSSQHTEAWLVMPGESLRATPSNLDAVKVRCQVGQARCRVTIIPG